MLVLASLLIFKTMLSAAAQVYVPECPIRGPLKYEEPSLLLSVCPTVLFLTFPFVAFLVIIYGASQWTLLCSTSGMPPGLALTICFDSLILLFSSPHLFCPVGRCWLLFSRPSVLVIFPWHIKLSWNPTKAFSHALAAQDSCYSLTISSPSAHRLFCHRPSGAAQMPLLLEPRLSLLLIQIRASPLDTHSLWYLFCGTHQRLFDRSYWPTFLLWKTVP